jgi:hypothetical protein
MLEKHFKPLIPYVYQPQRYSFIIIPYDPRSYISGIGESIYGYIKDDHIYNILTTDSNELNNQSIKMVIGQDSKLVKELTYLCIIDCEYRNGTIVIDIQWLKKEYPEYFENDWEKIKNNYQQM